MRFSFFFLIGFLPLSVAVFAAPREHRGTYFSVGTGIAYNSFRISETERDDLFIDGSCTFGVWKYKWEFGGWTFPALDFRFGRSVGNAVAIYGDFNFFMASGKLKANKTFFPDDEILGVKFREETLKNVLGAFGCAGIGVEVYPFRNPNSFLRGFHFGNTYSFGADLARFDGGERSLTHGIGGFLRTNLGMDWWVSDTWMLGMEISYMSPTVRMVNLKEKNTFQLLFRITRG